jgi:hypothetical protein
LAIRLDFLASKSLAFGGLYHIVADASFALEDGTQIVYFYGDQSIVSTESSAASATSKSSPTFLAIRLDFLASKSLAFN